MKIPWEEAPRHELMKYFTVLEMMSLTRDLQDEHSQPDCPQTSSREDTWSIPTKQPMLLASAKFVEIPSEKDQKLQIQCLYPNPVQVREPQQWE